MRDLITELAVHCKWFSIQSVIGFDFTSLEAALQPKIIDVVIPALVKILKEEWYTIRVEATNTLANLGEIGSMIPSAILCCKILTSCFNLRIEEGLQKTIKSALPKVIEMLQDENWQVRISALNGIAKLGGQSTPSISVEVALTELSARVTEKFQVDVKALIPEMAEFLRDPRWGVRDAAEEAFARMGRFRE